MLRHHPHLRSLVKRCRHCQILFITHPRNRGRNDLRCPFGCRQAHRKIKSSKRSTDYYKTRDGKFKKKLLNERRTEKNPKKTKIDPCRDLSIDQTTLSHIQLVTTIIEGHHVCLKQVILLVGALLRQHSIDLAQKSIYTCSYPRKQPP